MVTFGGGEPADETQLGAKMVGAEAGTGPIANMIGSQLATKSKYRSPALAVAWTVNDTAMSSPAWWSNLAVEGVMSSPGQVKIFVPLAAPQAS